jgi:hypothetical protein
MGMTIASPENSALFCQKRHFNGCQFHFNAIPLSLKAAFLTVESLGRQLDRGAAAEV